MSRHCGEREIGAELLVFFFFFVSHELCSLLLQKEEIAMLEDMFSI